MATLIELADNLEETARYLRSAHAASLLARRENDTLSSPQKLGGFLRGLRSASDLTQADLGTMAGISREYVHQLEHGEANVSVGVLQSIFAVYGLSLTIMSKEKGG